ncbi:Peptide hydrolase [Mycena venus]|uniref:Peptide hydrolase n=1 Tax=Mycena venus TaxID=2733690 RepID=A0A8H6YBJ9_9AGAR|nr:Peptide hydrolase [Mycena venus]
MSLLSPKWGLGRSLLALSPFFLVAPLIALKQHHSLPEPETALTNARTNLPQISEARVLGYAKYLSENIGYRTVGTYEHAQADAWMVEQAEEAKRNCERVVKETGRKLQCEVWRQQGSGTHRFDMMGKRLYKSYQNLTNIVVRVSDGTDAGKEHALLLNSHLDSTLPSPGAADDAISVGIMLDCIRVLVDTPGWSPAYAVIFLFNHAEESLQDGSHLFSTQHPIAHTVRAVINLEAAGTTGRELLFQATSEEMVEAYSHVPRPFGTIFANDIFNSGVLLSDTDFRQFEEYLDVPGLDIAIVGNSYLYHMRKDLVENIEAGVAQNMGENTLALIRHLTAPGSPIPTLVANSSHKHKHMRVVYFGLMSHFFMYRFSTAKVIYGALLLGSLVLTRSAWRGQRRGVVAVMSGLLGSLLTPNIVALVMHRVLGKGMSWFAGGHFAAIALYAPATLLGGLASQLFVPTTDEKTVFSSILLLQTATAFGIQLFNVGSAAMFFISGLPIFVALLINNAVLTTRKGEISLWSYALGQFLPLLTGTLIMVPTVEVFVPLVSTSFKSQTNYLCENGSNIDGLCRPADSGDVPADNIVATIISVLGSQAVPLAIPFAHRFGRKSLRTLVLLLGAATLMNMAIYMRKDVFDEMHQKRLFVLHLENVTTHEQHLHIASADGAPGFHELVRDISNEFGSGLTTAEPAPLIMNDYNSDWDSLYPFSAFLSPYKIELPRDPDYISPWTARETSFILTAVNDVTDLEAGTRSFTLQVNHPGLIWTVIAFDAHVLKWNLDNNPPTEYARHHVKEASFYKADTWTLDLVVKLPEDGNRGILFNFIGLQEKAMWPGKMAVKAEGGPAMKLFENLDSWLEEKMGGTMDALLLGCVAGTTVV